MPGQLDGKAANIDGAGGGIGSGVAPALARERARVFPASHRARGITASMTKVTCGLVMR